MVELCKSKRKSCKNSHTHNHTVLLVLIVITMPFFAANAFQTMTRNGRSSRTFRLRNIFPRRATSNDASPSAAAQSSYDMVIVGGGSAGLTAAKFAGGTLKKSVLIVEEERLGGDCTWTGCVPSKSLLSKAKASQMARNYAIQQHSTSNGSSSNDDEIGEAHRDKSRANFDKVQAYFRRVQQEIYEEDDSPRALEKFGIETIEGQKARLVTPTTLSFQKGSITTTVEAKDGILLCTGAKPNRPTNSIPGLSSIDYLTYEEIWTRDFGGSLPKKWTVVGGGPIGCELAQALSRLGASVTIITGSSGRLLPGVDDVDVSEMMKEVFEEDENITVLQGKLTKVESASSENPSYHVAFVETIRSKESISVEGDAMLLSIGRKPNTKGLGLETLGIDLDPKTGGIAVDTTLKTTVDGIYAAGDCTGDKQFTHYAGTYYTLCCMHACMNPFTIFYVCSSSVRENCLSIRSLTPTATQPNTIHRAASFLFMFDSTRLHFTE